MTLGNVKIEYNHSGEVISASFKPAEFKNFDKRLLLQLKNIQNSRDIKDIQYNAEMIFAGWVNAVSDLDLTDLMFDKKLTSKVHECNKYEDGLVKVCELEFSLEENEIKN